tara:strand:- start:26906 stop:27451 length:546 start_codon:yes stop_codon:yes gene_type:complete
MSSVRTTRGDNRIHKNSGVRKSRNTRKSNGNRKSNSTRKSSKARGGTSEQEIYACEQNCRNKCNKIGNDNSDCKVTCQKKCSNILSTESRSRFKKVHSKGKQFAESVFTAHQSPRPIVNKEPIKYSTWNRHVDPASGYAYLLDPNSGKSIWEYETWERIVDKDSGNTYFKDPKSGESVWER